LQNLLCYVKSLQNDLQQEKDESQDQKKLAGAYRDEVKKFEHLLEEKSRKEVCSMDVSVNKYI
jgi:Skp family chaperone for outer membrane proteins